MRESGRNGEPVTIGVTGSLASGKSTFVGLMRELGAETVSADELVHELLATDEETISAVAGRFGEEVRGESGIDRRRLAAVAFRSPEEIGALEEILHPRVRASVLERAAASEREVFVAEIPLLFESGFSHIYDLTVAVISPDERRMGWAAERGMSEEQVRGVEARQLSAEAKAERADTVVRNAGTLRELGDRAREVYESALSRSRARSKE